jgi:hypothetical protein
MSGNSYAEEWCNYERPPHHVVANINMDVLELGVEETIIIWPVRASTTGVKLRWLKARCYICYVEVDSELVRETIFQS